MLAYAAEKYTLSAVTCVHATYLSSIKRVETAALQFFPKGIGRWSGAAHAAYGEGQV